MSNPKEGVIAKAGPASAGTPSFQPAPDTTTPAGDNGQAQVADPPAQDPPATNSQAANNSAAAPTLTDDQLKGLSDDQLKSLLKNRGIDFEGDFTQMKERLSKPATPAPALTEEQKAEAAKAEEKRMLDLYIADGGTPEQFVAIKQVAAMDLRQLSEATIRREMKAEGYDDADIDAIIKERYYQLNPDELQKNKSWDEKEEKWIEESDEDFKKRKELLTKKVATFSKKLENRSLYIKKDAEEKLKELRDTIADQDAAKRKEEEFSSKVDEISKTLPRKITFELGEIDKQKIDPVDYDVTDAHIAEVVSELKDPAKRKQLFFNEDGVLDVSKVFNILLRNKTLESAVKTSYIVGGNRQVEVLKKVFPGSPHELGVGGSQRQNNQSSGKLVSAGKPQIVPNKV